MKKTSVVLASSELPTVPPEEIQLLPMGRFTARDGRGPWTVRDIGHAQRIVDASRDYIGSGEIPIDYDHQIVLQAQNGAKAIAAGWINQLEARPNGIWGKVRWTPQAAAHLSTREYRHISPTFTYNRTGDVMRITSAALTNAPALELKALASQQENPTMNEETVARLRALLGLDDGADDAALVQAVTNLTAMVIRLAGATSDDAPPGSENCSRRQEAAPSQVLAATVQRLAQTEGEMQEMAVQQRVGEAIREGKITPAMKDWALATCRADAAGFSQLLAVMPQIVQPSGRSWGALPPSQPEINEQRTAICRNLGIPETIFGRVRQE